MWEPFDRELETLGFQTITFDAPGTARDFFCEPAGVELEAST